MIRPQAWSVLSTAHPSEPRIRYLEAQIAQLGDCALRDVYRAELDTERTILAWAKRPRAEVAGG